MNRKYCKLRNVSGKFKHQFCPFVICPLLTGSQSCFHNYAISYLIEYYCCYYSLFQCGQIVIVLWEWTKHLNLIYRSIYKFCPTLSRLNCLLSLNYYCCLPLTSTRELKIGVCLCVFRCAIFLLPWLFSYFIYFSKSLLFVTYMSEIYYFCIFMVQAVMWFC